MHLSQTQFIIVKHCLHVWCSGSAVLSVAIAQICCSCSAVFCCVDAKKSADLISQCCASFDPITKYFLFKFGGLIKQSPPFSFSNKRNVQRFLKPPVRITRNTILLFLHWWHSFSDVLISVHTPHHAPHSRVVLMLWIVEILTFDKVILYNVYRVLN